jgi:hypothetical protein
VVRREIPLPLANEAGALLGVALGDAVVLAGTFTAAAAAYVAGAGKTWPLAALTGLLGLAALVRLDHEALWLRGVVWAVYQMSPRRYVPAVELDSDSVAEPPVRITIRRRRDAEK